MTKFLEMIEKVAEAEYWERMAKEKAAAEKKAAEFEHDIKIFENFIDLIPSKADSIPSRIEFDPEEKCLIIRNLKDDCEIYEILKKCNDNVYGIDDIKARLKNDNYLIDRKHFGLHNVDFNVECHYINAHIPVFSLIFTWDYIPIPPTPAEVGEFN